MRGTKGPLGSTPPFLAGLTFEIAGVLSKASVALIKDQTCGL